MDHVNRRAMLLQYKCDNCSVSRLKFYNPCSFLLHVREHFTLYGGEIILENLDVLLLPFGLGGFLSNPNIVKLYDVEDDSVGETQSINSRFYSPTPQSFAQPFIHFIANELLFFYSTQANDPSSYLVLKQISSNIPHCRFVRLDQNKANLIIPPTETEKDKVAASNNLITQEVTCENESETNSQQIGFKITKIESLKESTKSTIKLLTCPECEQSQTVPLREHFLQTNKPLPNLSKCEACKYVAPSKCSQRAHERTHSNAPPFVCPECGRQFAENETLKDHLEDVCFHSTKQVRFRCPARKCGKIFAQTMTFCSHFMTHMQPILQCAVCKKTFIEEDHYMEHKNSHTVNPQPAKVYKCTVCTDNKNFTQDTYDSHIDMHATDQKQCLYVYICKHCHSYFRSTITYATHLQRCSKALAYMNLIHSNKKGVVSFPAKEKLSQCLICKLFIKANAQDLFCGICRAKEYQTKKYFNFLVKANQLEPNSQKKFICVLCKRCLAADEIYIHFAAKKCKYSNPIVLLSSVQHTNSTVDDIQTKKRKRLLNVTYPNKQTKLSESQSQDNLSIPTTPSPIPFDGMYRCKICNYNDTERKEFHSHIMQHRAILTAYQCMECGDCFVVKPSLVKHLLYFHQITDAENYFQENNCFNKEAVKKLESVMRLAPGESKEPVGENQCRVCLKDFTNSTELNKHFRIHGMAFLLKNSK